MYVGEKHETEIIESVRPHGQGLLVRLRGYETPETAGRFRNQWVYVKSSEVPPLPEGQHYKYELVGLRVVEENGNPLGELVEILETGANDVYVIRGENGREVLLPAIPPVVLNVDMEARVMTVHLLDGLVDEKDA